MSLTTPAQELISRYLDGEVTPSERLWVEEQLKSVPEAAAYHEELRRLDRLLSSRATESTSADWEAKVQAALSVESDRPAAAKPPRRLMRVGMGAYAAVLLAVFVGAFGHIAMRRAWEGRGTQSADQIGESWSGGGNRDQLATTPARSDVSVFDRMAQHEPYYAQQNITTSRSESYNETDNLGQFGKTGTFTGITRAGTQRLMAAMMAGDWDSTRISTQYAVGATQTFGASVGDLTSPESEFQTEEYDRIYETRFVEALANPLSTFGIDVDTASYSNVRRFLTAGRMPPKDAVRIEELVNYFSYAYPQPKAGEAFSITTDVLSCPWQPSHQLVLIGLQGRTFQSQEPPESNLVFLIDVSGSMDQPDKLPLLQSSLKHMVRQLTGRERVAIVVYAGAAGLVLDSTSGTDKTTILGAIDRLKAGGSTAGAAGIQLAYQIASQHFIKGGNNRVILATDGDFNVGVSSTGELVCMIEEKRKESIFLTVLGFGTGNYKDGRMEQLADKGNGNYYYIDTPREGAKVLGEELGSTLFTIAKDVKIQVEFNPGRVKAYRLIGYENRVMPKEDFNDDAKDGGEMGAGHTVTALYELIPAGSEEAVQGTDPLAYQKVQLMGGDELMTIKLRYKEPDGEKSRLIVEKLAAPDAIKPPTGDARFAVSVAEFGLLLRGSEFRGRASYQEVERLAQQAIGQDPYGYRAEFLELVRKAGQLAALEPPSPSEETQPGIRFKGQSAPEE